jgi:hypothetical protein
MLVEFDKFAEISHTDSTSVLPMMISTDITSIPWELCITVRSEIPANEHKNWFQRYEIGTEVLGVSNGVADEEELAKIAVLLQPFQPQLLNDAPTVSRYMGAEAQEEFKSLLSSIDRIQQKGIKLDVYKCPTDGTEFDKIRAVLKEKQGLLLYLGNFNAGEHAISIQNPFQQEIDEIEVTQIQGGNRTVFLDAGRTTLQYGKNPPNDSAQPSVMSNLPEEFLRKGGLAFIGNSQDLHPVVANAFARHFLDSLTLEATSLAAAIHRARIQCLRQFAKEDQEQFSVQSSLFSLYGRSEDAIFSSFGHPRGAVSLIFAEINERYYRGFYKTIFPTSIPAIEPVPVRNWDEVVRKVEQSAGQCFIADLPLVRAANLISTMKTKSKTQKEENELLIIGGLFRLSKDNDDSVLYIPKKQSKEQGTFWCADTHSLVTLMAFTYFGRKGKVYVPMVNIYDYVLENAIKLVSSERYDQLAPFVLASVYREEFDKFLDDRKLKPNFEIVPLYKEFLTFAEDQFDTIFKADLLADVLVARKKDIQRDRALFEEIYARWTAWHERNKKGFPSTQQDFALSIDDNDAATLKALTSLVNKIGSSLGERAFPVKAEPISDADIEKILPRGCATESIEQSIQKDRLMHDFVGNELNQIGLKINEGIEGRVGTVLDVSRWSSLQVECITMKQAFQDQWDSKEENILDWIDKARKQISGDTWAPVRTRIKPSAETK